MRTARTALPFRTFPFTCPLRAATTASPATAYHLLPPHLPRAAPACLRFGFAPLPAFSAAHTRCTACTCHCLAARTFLLHCTATAAVLRFTRSLHGWTAFAHAHGWLHVLLHRTRLLRFTPLPRTRFAHTAFFACYCGTAHARFGLRLHTCPTPHAALHRAIHAVGPPAPHIRLHTYALLPPTHCYTLFHTTTYYHTATHTTHIPPMIVDLIILTPVPRIIPRDDEVTAVVTAAR